MRVFSSSVRSRSLSTANSPLRPTPCPSFRFRKARLIGIGRRRSPADPCHTTVSSRHEDATRRRRRGHPLFPLNYAELPACPLFRSCQPAVGTEEIYRTFETISLALNLLPFARIAFLWLIAVLRDRLGELEDRFFTTVFLGSGLLFVAMISPQRQ